MEQTSGTSYPNVLVTSYLRRTNQNKPELLARAMGLINIGYQKILTFQKPNGGFSWWARPNDPVQLWVTAYGLQQLIDTSRVYEIDENVIRRAQDWLISQQAKDGAWKTVGNTHGVAIAGFKEPALPLTAYVAWTLAESGYKGKPLTRALDYIRKQVRKEENVYVLALVAAALFSADPNDEDGHEAMEKLVGKARTEGDRMIFEPKGQTLSFARHGGASVETTALATYAALKSGRYPSVSQKGLNHLIHVRSSSGGWGSTQATILALKCLVQALSGKKPENPIHITVRLDGEERKITIDPEQADVLQLIDFGEAGPGTHRLEVVTQGEGSLMFQAVSRHFLPWSAVQDPGRSEAITFNVEYDRTKLSKKDLLTANVTMRYNGRMPTYMVIVDLGIPPGFDILTDSFDKMVAENRITKYERAGRQIVLYFGTIAPQEEVKFSYQMRPRYPVKVKTPSSQAYEYYTPENRSRTAPVEIEVGK